ncbi:MAG: hypothetical protein ABI604_03175 [Nitrospirota bacterium]
MENEEAYDKACLVCGKTIGHNGGFCRLNIGGHMVALCCPLCMATYEQNPTRFAVKLKILGINPPPARGKIEEGT